MRFNPPPNWPAPAEGFAPGPDWTPDPDLPPPPPGWQLWVEDDVVLAGETPEGVRHHQQAVTSFWVGVILFVAAAVVTAVSAKSGGFLWYGGMVFGLVALVRSVTTYRASRKDGAVALSGLAKGAVALGLVAVLGTGVWAASSFYSAETLNTAVGSCWAVTDDGQATPVSCDDDHDFTAVSEVDSQDECAGDGYIDATDDTGILCLEAG